MDDELLNDFINESREHLATIEADMLAIEEGGDNIDEALVNKVFRAAHSIKGGSAFFGMEKVKELAHKAETVLDLLRSRQMSPNAEVTNVLLEAFDLLREMIDHPAECESFDTEDMVTSLHELASSYLPTERKSSLEKEVKLQPFSGSEEFSLPQTDIDRAQRLGHSIYAIACDLIHDIEKQGKSVLDLFHQLWNTGEVLDCTLDFDAVGTLDTLISNQLPLRLVLAGPIDSETVEALFPNLPPDRIQVLFVSEKAETMPTAVSSSSISTEKEEPEPVSQSQSGDQVKVTVMGTETRSSVSSASSPEETLRVNVAVLETLMNLAGELVLSRNQLRAAVAQNNLQSLAAADQRINQVTTELQDVIMQTRLQPIGNVFNKFPRVVRDLSKSLGKEVKLDIYGQDVALDKSLIEGLSDPLTHMVRNAVDHGIETVDQRAEAKKKLPGRVRIEARHEAGQVVVEIEDDGKGIDPQKLADSALKKGLISPEKAQGMSDREKRSLIFLPGFSMASQVTEVSGRGVGMDVVKTNLEKLGGTVEITSEVGRGSLFRIRLPLTLAIIPSLIVSVESERFAIPQINIEELLRLRAEEVKQRIEVVGGAEVLLLRERLLPLVWLDQVLGVEEINQQGEHQRYRLRSQTASALEIAVVTTGTVSYGLVVGSFHDTEEIVVKPLGRQIKGLQEYAGATILGDGAVALILDIAGVAEKAELSSVSGSARAHELLEELQRDRLLDTHSLLLFHNGPYESCAIPLDIVQRIERIKPEQIERAGGQRTMQYRGGSLPLMALSDAASVQSIDEEGDRVVLVFNMYEREVGLLGSMPIDTIETRIDIDQKTHRQPGIAGSSIILDRTTLIVDLFELVDVVFPDWRESRKEIRQAIEESGKPTVLLAEDSDFFRSQIKRFLEEEGYTVLDAPDGQAAWDLLLEHADQVSIVVTDIEMPQLTGLELAENIRNDERTSRLPVIAVTALAGEENISKGQAAGIDEYLVKLDRDSLLSSVHALTGSR